MNPVLIDTSVWVRHFRQRSNTLMQLLSADLVLLHPMVWAELASGTFPAPRAQTLADLASLQMPQQAGLLEVVDFTERETLFSESCGLVDLPLLGSTLITPKAELWSLDKRLAALTRRFGVLYTPASR